jgi:aspartate kinase
MTGERATGFLRYLQVSPWIQKKKQRPLVVKFGGTSMGTPEKILHCAEMVKREIEKGSNVVVVVSAQSGDTDRLSQLARVLGVPRDSIDEIVSMGERVSIRLMCAVLTSMGVKSTFIDPLHKEWPVRTDSNHGAAEIILGETKKRVNTVIGSFFKRGITPVLGGFIGKSEGGKVTTLGRGGSDITGVLLGYCLDADVYIVTDVEGIYSADPNTVRDTQVMKVIGTDELWDLGVCGAKVMDPRSLVYKTEDMNLKVLSNNQFLDGPGTEIIGFFDSGTHIYCDEREKSMVSVVGGGVCDGSGLLGKLSQALQDFDFYSISASSSCISFIVDSDKERDMVQALHTLVLRTPLLRAVTSRRGIASMRVVGRDFNHRRKFVRRIGDILDDAHIDIVNISINLCEAILFVEWQDRKKAKLALEKNLKIK